MSTIFKEKRLSLGLSLDKISEDLRIRKRFLEAIEDGNLDQIEFSSFYLAGYMKLYAKYLHIQDQDIAELLEVPETEVIIYETRPEVKDPSWNFIVISLISMILVVLYGKSTYHKISDNLSYAFRGKEQHIESLQMSKEEQVKEILGKYVNFNKAVILIKKPTFLKIQGSEGQLIFDGIVDVGDVQLAPNNKGIVVFSTAIDDIEIFLEDALVSQNGVPKNPLFVEHRIFDQNKE
jgi:hypothetical protein